MKKISILAALLVMPFVFFFEDAAHGEEMTNAPFPAMVTGLDFESTGDGPNEKYGCQLTTASEDKIRLRWIPSESSVERMSVRDKTVRGRTKVAVVKLAEKDGVAVYGYREANTIVLLVPAMETFSTVTGTGDRMFMQQTCGLGITLLFSKPLASDEGGGCDTRQGGTHLPGFCGRLARLDGRISPTVSFSISAGLGEAEKVRILIKTRPTKPDGTAIVEP
jgi:hypothetical protein